MEKYNYYVKIADILIHIKIPFQIEMKKEIKEFICDKGKEDILIEFIGIDKLISISGKLVFENVIKIYKEKDTFINELHSAPEYPPFGWLIRKSDLKYNVLYLLGKEKYLKYSRNILDAICIEQILNNKNAFILHSSYINFNGKSILFSAPSGTGKSTQADLWEKYENAEIINGDRTAIRKIDGKWNAYGLPIAGSSNIFKNKKAELSHIIILKQGKENKLKKLSPREAFIKIYSETTIHTWDSEFQNNIISMITDMVQNVQIYQYECLPDKSAVDFLKEQIIKDRGLFLENNE